MSIQKDFDPVTGKLVQTSEIDDLVKRTRPVGPAKEPILANPIKLQPSGSPPAKLHSPDWFRALFTGISSYGALTMVISALDYFGANTSYFPVHGAEWGAFLLSGAALLSAYMRDNTPRVP